MKRILSFLLCLMLLVGCVTTAAFASEEQNTIQDDTVSTQDTATDKELSDDLPSSDTEESSDSHTVEDELGNAPEDPTTNDTIEDTDISWSVTDGVLTITGTGTITDGDSSETETAFTDVTEDEWYYSEVMYCYENGLMKGMSDTIFSPNTNGTRAQVVTVLYRLAGEPTVSGNGDFPDVASDKWYTAAVAWAKENGITTGYEDGTFRPDNYVTRQEFITFLYRYLVEDGSAEWATSTASDTFSDTDSVQSWAKEATNWSIATGLQNGYEEEGKTLLKPNTSIRRCEMAAFLYRSRSYTTDSQDKMSIAEGLIGETVDALYAAIGQPNSSDYTASCLVIDGEDGLLYYDDFTVATVRLANGTERILSVTLRQSTITDTQDKKATAEALIGNSVDDIYAAVGQPISTEYTASCLVPNAEDGLLYYSGFTVGTIRYESGTELVIGVY